MGNVFVGKKSERDHSRGRRQENSGKSLCRKSQKPFLFINITIATIIIKQCKNSSATTKWISNIHIHVYVGIDKSKMSTHTHTHIHTYRLRCWLFAYTTWIVLLLFWFGLVRFCFVVIFVASQRYVAFAMVSRQFQWHVVAEEGHPLASLHRNGTIFAGLRFGYIYLQLSHGIFEETTFFVFAFHKIYNKTVNLYDTIRLYLT